MSTHVPARRLVALQAKLAILKQETAAWLADSKDAAARFALHRSQIAEVCENLDEMHRLVADELKALPAAAELAKVEALERRILAAMQIWDSYRAKWSLRVEAKLRNTLNMIDDLAWKAYRPAHDRALASGWLDAARARLPPLVFTNPRWSPFARSRERGYELDEGSGVLEEIDDFEPYLRAMPVPLIGIPWTQAAHLPDAVFVGHEVGHLVEEDLGLEAALKAVIERALAGADAEHRAVWAEHWRSEVFADLWGVLCCGPAFAETLIDLLIGADDVGKQKQPDAYDRWGPYPTHALRAEILVAAVRELDNEGIVGVFTQAAQLLKERWHAAHPSHAMAEFEADVVPLVHALMCTPLKAFASAPGEKGQALRSVLPFDADMQADALKDAADALAQHSPGSEDVRTLFAGLALAFVQSPEKFREMGAQQRFVQRLEQRRTQGVRANEVAANVAQRPTEKDRRRAAAATLFALTDQRLQRSVSKVPAAKP